MSAKAPLPPIPDHAPGSGSVWKHYKTGTLYQVLTVGRHSETLEPVVVYQPFLDDSDEPWIRALAFSPENQWPGFLDLTGPDGETLRFRHVAGPLTRAQGKDDSSGLGSLARLVNIAIEMDENGPAVGGDVKGILAQNPNWRRLLRVVRAMSETLFEEDQPTPEGPVDIERLNNVLDVAFNGT